MLWHGEEAPMLHRTLSLRLTSLLLSGLLIGSLAPPRASAGLTVRVNVRSSGAQANGGSFAPSLSATGRFVAFESLATNLVPGDTNDEVDIFVHDRDADGNGVFDEPGGIA